jgi:predicted amidohydrolase
MSRPLPIIAVQAAPVAWDVSATWTKFETETRELHASFPGARLVLFPELYLSALGPLGTRPKAGYSSEAIAEPIPGPLTERLCELASRLGIWLVPGSFYERGDDGKVYNTAVAISPAGDLVARYRKCFPWRPWERTAAGGEFVVFDVDGVGRAGLMICYDGWFPEVARHLAWMGAEVILQPTATGTSDRDQELVLARSNAIVNQVYVVNVNMGGRPGPGRSIIVDPEGHVLQTAGDGEEFLTDVLDLDAVARVREYGSVGLNRMWAQLEAEGGELELPLYRGSFRPAVPSA